MYGSLGEDPRERRWPLFRFGGSVSIRGERSGSVVIVFHWIRDGALCHRGFFAARKIVFLRVGLMT
jgi:hypothetical protein